MYCYTLIVEFSMLVLCMKILFQIYSAIKKKFFLEFEMIHLNSYQLLHFKAFLVDSAEFYFILLFLDPLQQILFCMSECYGHIVCEVCVCLVQCLSVWHSLHIVPFFPNFVFPNLVFPILPSLFLVLNI